MSQAPSWPPASNGAPDVLRDAPDLSGARRLPIDPSPGPTTEAGDAWDVLAGRFEIRRWLGDGGMGIVYEAFDLLRREPVAVKMLRRPEPRKLRQLRREFRALHDITHPNLVNFGEFFDCDANPFFTMELVEGVDLLRYIRPAGSTPDRGCAEGRSGLDLERLRHALAQLATAIAALHAAGKVHRDIKPTNVLVDASGKLTLLDFGLALENHMGRRSTEGGPVGTIAYMAPEQALDAAASEASDWYAFGVVIYEALTGTLPHDGMTPYRMLLARARESVPPPSRLMSDVPPDLDALCADLLQMEPNARPRGPQVLERLGVQDTDFGVTRTTTTHHASVPAGPFVGRERELQQLFSAFEGAANGPRICVVEGPSGVGKSQLADEFAKRLPETEADTLVLEGRCYEREVVSYKAFDGIAEALSSHLAHLPEREVSAVLPDSAALLGELFPTLMRVSGIALARRSSEDPDPLEQRRQMFRALRELFERLSEKRRLVWYIDDLHWTDTDSLVLLRELLTHEEPLPVLVLATMRSTDRAQYQSVASDLKAMAPMDRIELRELSYGESRKLAHELIPKGPPELLEAVAREGMGLPLFVHELARHVTAADPGSVRGASLDQMLSERIEQLNPTHRHVLRLVCLCGGPVTQEVVALAATLSDAEIHKALRVLKAAHLVRTTGLHRADRVLPYHDRVREIVCSQMASSWCQHLHERLAVAMEQTGAARHTPRALVHHAQAAGLDDLTAKYALQAARAACTGLAFDQAAGMFAIALSVGDYDEDARRALRLELARALVHAGRGPEAAEVFLQASEGADPAARLECHRQAAEQWILTGHLERGFRTLDELLALIGERIAPTPRRALAHVLYNRACLRLRGTSYKPRLESQLSEQHLRRLDVLRAVALGLSTMDPIRAAHFNTLLLRQALRTGESQRLLQALGAEVVFLASQGGRAGRRAKRLIEQVHSVAASSRDAMYGRAWPMMCEGSCALFEGRFSEANEVLSECEEALSRVAEVTTFERNTTRVFRVLALRQLGALRRTDALVAESIRSAEQRSDLYMATSVALLRGPCLLARGDTHGARHLLEANRWSPPDHAVHIQHYYEARARGELALYEGRAGEALAELVPQFAAIERSMLMRVRLLAPCARSVQGKLLIAAARDSRDPRDTLRRVERLTRLLESEDMGYADAFASVLRAAMANLDPAQDEAAVVGHLRHAAELAEKAELGWHLAAVRDRLGRRIGGDEGASLRTQAAEYAAAESVVDSERFFEVAAPGLLD